MSNPYQSPEVDPRLAADPTAYRAPSPNDFGWIKQVRVFAILNAVEGALELPMGLFVFGMAFFIPAMLRQQAEGQAQAIELSKFLTIWYAVIGGLLMASSILRIVAAIRSFDFKGRALGIASVAFGLAAVFGVYCAPTAVGLLVYGLMVYLNPAVAAAFRMRASGMSVGQIYVAFSPFAPAGMTTSLPTSF